MSVSKFSLYSSVSFLTKHYLARLFFRNECPEKIDIYAKKRQYFQQLFYGSRIEGTSFDLFYSIVFVYILLLDRFTVYEITLFIYEYYLKTVQKTYNLNKCEAYIFLDTICKMALRRVNKAFPFYTLKYHRLLEDYERLYIDRLEKLMYKVYESLPEHIKPYAKEPDIALLYNANAVVRLYPSVKLLKFLS